MMIKRCKTWLHLSWLYVQRMAAEKRRWRSIPHDGFREPRVFYGHEHIPARHEPSGGALIKFQDLNDVFPNTRHGANVLYLVNSAMPHFAPVMVREAKRAGAVFVLNQNGVAYPGWHGPGWEKSNRPYRFLIRQADHVLYQSEFCKQGADLFLGHCPASWQILHNPVDTTVFVPAVSRPEGLRLLLAGSHQHFYRVRTALEMMKLLKRRVPKVTLTIAGRYTWKKSEKECMEEAWRFAGEVGVADRVAFQGGYTQAEAPSLFQRHHILLHTKYNDPCPRLVVEAMACGLPVVYSASGGVVELVGEEGGVGIPAPLDWEQDHPPAAEELVSGVLSVSSALEQYSRTARARATMHFDVKPWLHNHAKIFQELLEKRRSV